MRKREKRVVILCSGGVDSAVLLNFYLKKSFQVFPLYVDGGSFWSKAERYWLGRFLAGIKTKDLKPLVCIPLNASCLYGKHWSVTGRNVPSDQTTDDAVYIPGKNLLLLTLAGIYAANHDIRTIALAPLRSNPFSDASPAFFKKMERVLKAALSFPVAIQTPFLSLSKRDVLRMGEQLPFELTFSCISPKKMIHCGQCNKCSERKKAFKNSGIQDGTRYVDDRIER